MLIPLRNKKLKLINFVVIALAVILFVLPLNTATAATTKSELINRLSQQLGAPASNSSGAVLGDQSSVPFFPRGFVYPIPELGNCDNQASCFQFCEQQENLEFCAMVSYRQGTMNASQLKKTLTFSHYLRSDYFANCNDLASCAKVCDQKDFRADCDLVAMSLDQGIRVLGATDTIPSNNFSIVDYCKNNYNCGNEYGGSNAMTAMQTLISSGYAPSFCNNVEQCEEYCSSAQSSECSDLYNNIAYLSGTLTESQSMGRVLEATTDGTQDTTSMDVPTTPVAYQPKGMLSCVIDAQVAPTPVIQTDAQQSDTFMSNVQQCDKTYSATQGSASSYASGGKGKAKAGVSDIYNCVIGLKSSADILNCL